MMFAQRVLLVPFSSLKYYMITGSLQRRARLPLRHARLPYVYIRLWAALTCGTHHACILITRYHQLRPVSRIGEKLLTETSSKEAPCLQTFLM